MLFWLYTHFKSGISASHSIHRLLFLLAPSYHSRRKCSSTTIPELQAEGRTTLWYHWKSQLCFSPLSFLGFIPLSGREYFVSEVCEMHTQNITLQMIHSVLNWEIRTLTKAKFDLPEFCFLRFLRCKDNFLALS